MRRSLLIPVLIGSLALVLAAATEADVFQSGNVRVKFNAAFDPHALPRRSPAPIKVEITGSIATTDGSHPPALRWLEIELNRHGRLTTTGLPVCSAAVLQSTTTGQALARCGPSVVGRGDFEAEVSLGGDVAAAGKIIAFNSRLDGRSALMLHFFARVPVRFTLVVPLRIVRRYRGDFGTLLRTRVPKLAGGLGSITKIDLTVWRRYSLQGKRQSYLAAACPAPAHVDLVPFAFARARFRFEGHPEIHTTVLDSCRVRA